MSDKMTPGEKARRRTLGIPLSEVKEIKDKRPKSLKERAREYNFMESFKKTLDKLLQGPPIK